MKSFLVIFILTTLSACAGSALTPAPYPSDTPPLNPTPTPIPTDEAFISALYDRIDRDETIPATGKLAVAALYDKKPAYHFQNNTGLVLQFNILDYPDPLEAKEAAVLLIGTGVSLANEYGMRLTGIEVLYYRDETRPWLTLWSTPPFGGEQIFLTPLADELVEDLTEKRLGTPTPIPTATHLPFY